jgi:hypothetical protein
MPIPRFIFNCNQLLSQDQSFGSLTQKRTYAPNKNKHYQ